VINLRTAKRSLTTPPTLLARADADVLGNVTSHSVLKAGRRRW
jgi:hypothetical protein